MSHIRRALLAVAAAVLVAGAAGGLRLEQVHDDGWEWTLSPSAAPPKVVHEGRDYLRGGERDSLPGDVVRDGRTPGGGIIYGIESPGTPTVIWVADGEDVWTYGLMGGP